MMVFLDPNISPNSPKIPLFIILVDLDGVLASMVWGAHAVSKRTLIGVTDLQSLGHLRLMVQKIFPNRVGGGD